MGRPGRKTGIFGMKTAEKPVFGFRLSGEGLFCKGLGLSKGRPNPVWSRAAFVSGGYAVVTVLLHLAVRSGCMERTMWKGRLKR